MTLAEQIVVGIVQSVFGPSDVVSAEKIASAASQLAAPPNGATGRALAFFCQQFLNSYRNWNYDSETNGERWILKRLSTFQLSVIFDVGANVGNWLLMARTEVPRANIHAFEIIEDTSNVLAKRVAGQAGIVINRFGLSDRSGTVVMRAFDVSNELASHMPYPHGNYREVTCEVRCGDEYLRHNDIAHIDLLKLDVEGAEHLVLKGFTEAIQSGRIDVIQFEYGKMSILTHFLLKDFYDLLEASGYAVGKIYPDHVEFRTYTFDEEDFLGPNYLAVRCARADIVEALRKR